MSMPQALIAQAQPRVVQAKARQVIEHEISKGCQPALSPSPLALEPLYQELHEHLYGADNTPEQSILVLPPQNPEDLVRLGVWISTEQALDWNRSELFLKQLTKASHRIGFEVRGNKI